MVVDAKLKAPDCINLILGNNFMDKTLNDDALLNNVYSYLNKVLSLVHPVYKSEMNDLLFQETLRLFKLAE